MLVLAPRQHFPASTQVELAPTQVKLASRQPFLALNRVKLASRQAEPASNQGKPAPGHGEPAARQVDLARFRHNFDYIRERHKRQEENRVTIQKTFRAFRGENQATQKISRIIDKTHLMSYNNDISG